MKTGTTIAEKLILNQRELILEGRSGKVYPVVLIPKTRTRKVLNMILDFCGSEINNTKTFNHGNPAKSSYIKRVWNMSNLVVLTRTKRSSPRILGLQLNKSLLAVRLYSSGGKISEEANDSSNVEYSGRYVSRNKCAYLLPNSELLLGTSTNATNINEFRDQDLRRRGSQKTRTITWPKGRVIADKIEKIHKEQLHLVKVAEKYGINSIQVQRLQEILARSLDFRIVAIANLANSSGSSTPGVDGVILNTKTKNEEKLKLVEWLKSQVSNGRKYKSLPIKRIFIPKTNGKLRPLGIPTIKDRALQSLLNMILIPIVEMNSDEESYGYRPFRSAKNAIGSVRKNLLSTHESRWILDADINGFFDNINHEWIMKNVSLPMSLKLILKNWLKAKIIYNGETEVPTAETPQGGIISPTLANLTLNGLEKTVYDSIKCLTKSKDQRMVIKQKSPSGGKRKLSLSVAITRYADDFVVIARSKHILITYIKPAITKFLYERGLTLSPEKTKIFSLKDQKSELNFLGYTFKYKVNWKHSRGFLKEHIGESGIALFPQKSKILDFNRSIRGIFRKSSNLTAFELISNLNPKIRGFCNYYNIGNCAKFKDYLRQALYHLTWKWAKKKHPRWGKRSVANMYFLKLKSDQRKWKDLSQAIPFKGTRWTFRGLTKKNSHFKDQENVGKANYLLNPSSANTIQSSLNYRMSSKLIKIHAFHEEYMKLIEFANKNNLLAQGKYSSFKEKLLKKQENECTICHSVISLYHFSQGSVHIHHTVPVHRKGAKADIRNMQLVHSWCHRTVNHWEAISQG
jgi:RNA-directed DNA polymerase